MSMIIGLTGPTGAGKSRAALTAAKAGFKVIDCDKLAHAETEKGTAGYEALVSVFGGGILHKDGELNRKALAEIAFSTKENTELLNKTVLPHIVTALKAELNSPRVLLDAPTLFESGVNTLCDAVIAVLADKEIRLARICARDGIDKEAAMLRINAGKTDEFYRQNADYIIYNNGEEGNFVTEFEKIISHITGKI